MSESSAATDRYTMIRVYRYIVQVESAYNVSIKPWINFGAAAGGDPDLSISAWGSGNAFDLIPEGVQPRACKVYCEEVNCLGEALYWSVVYVERLLAKMVEPIGPRPVL